MTALDGIRAAVGGDINVNYVLDNRDGLAILHMAHSSQDQGTALAKVLFGEYNPGGKLVSTWPASENQLPARMDYNIRHGYTYMYFKGTPLFPFGHGLSYTSFKYARLRTSAPHIGADGSVTVSVDVTNAGARACRCSPAKPGPWRFH